MKSVGTNTGTIEGPVLYLNAVGSSCPIPFRAAACIDPTVQSVYLPADLYAQEVLDETLVGELVHERRQEVVRSIQQQESRAAAIRSPVKYKNTQTWHTTEVLSATAPIEGDITHTVISELT